MANFVVYETDERMFFLKKLLTGLRPLVNTHIFAPNLVLSAERLKDIGDGETLVCGRLDEGAEKLAECKNLRVCRILENEKFQARNARLTAEGALALILDHSMLSLDDMRVLVLGFGRTGAAVVRLMDKLDVSVDIATTASPRPAGAFAGEIVLPGDADLALYDVVVNTVPQRVIDDERALALRHDAVYIDLASSPGINLAMLQGMGLDAEIYPALPAKCSPESAAAAMRDYILEVTA